MQGQYSRVPLRSRGGSVVGYTLVDAADAAWVAQWTWRLRRSSADLLYATRGERRGGRRGKTIHIMLHRELVGLPRSPGKTTSGRLEPDHINGDGLDNRRANLRVVTHAENLQNKRPYRRRA